MRWLKVLVDHVVLLYISNKDPYNFFYNYSKKLQVYRKLNENKYFPEKGPKLDDKRT